MPCALEADNREWPHVQIRKGANWGFQATASYATDGSIYCCHEALGFYVTFGTTRRQLFGSNLGALATLVFGAFLLVHFVDDARYLLVLAGDAHPDSRVTSEEGRLGFHGQATGPSRLRPGGGEGAPAPGKKQSAVSALRAVLP